jgi:hypothetical protein
MFRSLSSATSHYLLIILLFRSLSSATAYYVLIILKMVRNKCGYPSEAPFQKIG